jgi:hypothetical protein
MSISSALMTPQVASLESATASARSPAPAVAAAPQTSVPASSPAVGSPTEPPPPAPAVSSPAQFSTDREIDSQHKIYYEFIDDRTGDVVFEIPPQALREIGESLNLPLLGDASVPSIDVKS